MCARRFRVVLAVFTITANRCSDQGPGVAVVQPPVVADSAGVRIVRNLGPAWRDGRAWTVSAEPVLRIGMVDGAAEYRFDRIAGITRLPNGTIVVLDAGIGELRYYSAAGVHVRSAGRAGEGPGELRAPRYLERVGADAVQVTHTWEPAHHRSEALVATAPWTLERADTLPGRFLIQELYMHRHAGRLYPAAYGRKGLLAVGGRPRKLLYASSNAHRIEADEIDKGELSLARGLQIFELGRDYVLGRVRDDDGVEYVVMYSLSRTARGPAN